MAAPKLDTKVEKKDTPKPQPPPETQLARQESPAEIESDAEEPSLGEHNKKGGGRIVPVHQSRIRDRPAKDGEKDSTLKIQIELDLEVEVEIYARVKGDVTIGLL